MNKGNPMDVSESDEFTISNLEVPTRAVDHRAVYDDAKETLARADQVRNNLEPDKDTLNKIREIKQRAALQQKANQEYADDEDIVPNKKVFSGVKIQEPQLSPTEQRLNEMDNKFNQILKLLLNSSSQMAISVAKGTEVQTENTKEPVVAIS